MKHNRVSSEGASLGKRGLGALGLFAVVPLTAALIFLLMNDDAQSVRGRTDLAQESQLFGNEEARARAPERASKPASSVPEPQEMTRAPQALPHGKPRSVTTGVDKGSFPPSTSYADKDAARLARFDENAQAFDERLLAFDGEQGSVDERASEKVKAALQSSLEALHPEIRVAAMCTLSVCVVELASPDPVGTMIARISPWLRTHTRAAMGDPVDASDENSLRLAFDKVDALSDF